MTANFFLKKIIIFMNIQIFENILIELKSLIYFLPFETIPGAKAYFLWKWHANKESFILKQNNEEMSLLQK